jgi:hypothetical protein
VPAVARVLESARLGQAAEDVTMLALGFVPGVDPKTLEVPLAEVAAGIAADELLRDRLSGGLQIVLSGADDLR